MLRSFVVLARTQNLSHATRQLGITRQTIRRHLATLEELRGESLFKAGHQGYTLTDSGAASLTMAEKVLRQSARWLDPQSGVLGGLSHAMIEMGDNDWFASQQHPLNAVWSLAPPLLQNGLQAWVSAEGALESPPLLEFAPHLVVYRLRNGEWLCVAVGEQSSYATWLGDVWAKSAIGRPFHDDPIQSEADRLLIEPYEHVNVFGGAWYDHVHAVFPRTRDGERLPVKYQRLVMACNFPDREPAVAALIARTENVKIDGVSQLPPTGGSSEKTPRDS